MQKKSIDLANKAWEENNMTNDLMDKWLIGNKSLPTLKIK